MAITFSDVRGPIHWWVQSVSSDRRWLGSKRLGLAAAAVSLSWCPAQLHAVTTGSSSAVSGFEPASWTQGIGQHLQSTGVHTEKTWRIEWSGGSRVAIGTKRPGYAPLPQCCQSQCRNDRQCVVVERFQSIHYCQGRPQAEITQWFHVDWIHGSGGGAGWLAVWRLHGAGPTDTTKPLVQKMWLPPRHLTTRTS